VRFISAAVTFAAPKTLNSDELHIWIGYIFSFMRYESSDHISIQNQDKSVSSWLYSCCNPLHLDSWQVSYESHGWSRISWFALKEF
jgi:hypothetical protein